MPPHLPGGLEDFVDHVMPLLQEWGLLRTEYSGRTLRTLKPPKLRHLNCRNP